MKYHNYSSIDQLRQLTSGPFLIDNMKNEASEIYGSLPERLYIILNNKIVYQVCKVLSICILVTSLLRSIYFFVFWEIITLGMGIKYKYQV